MNIRQTVSNFFMEQDKPGQTFSINVAISHLKGGEDVQWTTRYERTCRRMTDDYERKICKFESQWSAINLLISKMVALRAQCRNSGNPETCSRTLQNAMLAERIKQRKIRAQIQQIRRERDQAGRAQRTAQRQQPTGER